MKLEINLLSPKNNLILQPKLNYMKKIYTIISLLLLALYASANPVSKELAKKVAINFFSAKKSSAIDTFQVTNTYTHFDESKEAFYIFSFPKGGFVIVSADDEANPIIGYSITSPTTKKIDNPVILSRFDWYAKQVSNAAKSKYSKIDVKAEWKSILDGKISKGTETIGPLLQTTWDQSPYYNQLCPPATPTGCVATAMSQIMRYHNWPNSGNGSHNYTHTTYGIQSADFSSTTYEWSVMPNSLSSGNTSQEKLAIATICYHAGVSVDMNYAEDGSGAFSQDVLYALTSYFKYDPTTINITYFDANQQTSWVNQLKSEIDAGRPVFFSGSSTNDGGHAWICDGYDDYNKFHINWGWGGYYNGYFSVTSMKPGTYNFSENNSIITGIKPGNSIQSMLWVKQASGFITNSRGIRSISAVDNNIAWAVAYDGSGNSEKVKDFTKTINGGKDWISGTINTTGTTGLEFSMISAISANTAWVAMFDGSNGGGKILKTTNGGSSWTHQSTASFSAPNGFPNVIHFWDENDGFCMGDPNGGYFEIYTTSNGGDTWTRVPQTNIPAISSQEFGTIGMYDVYGNTVWFSTNKGRIFKSTDKGYTWVVYQTPLTSENFEISFKDENIGVIQSRGNDAIKNYKTTNGGQSWTQINPSGNFYTSSFKYIPNSNILVSSGADYQTPAQGISYSLDDANTFIDYADFYKNFQFLTLGTSPNGTVWAGGYNNSQYNGGMWCLNSGAIFSRFSANKKEVVKNSPVIYTDQSLGNPDSWEWDFGATATPQTASGQGSHSVTYTEYGYKTVTLTISKGTDQYVFINNKAVFVNWATGIEPEEKIKQQYIYPNPASTEVYVKISEFEKGFIQVYNITGALMWQSNGITDDNRINISNLASGIYIVKIKDSNGSISSRKLTISR